MSDYFIPNIIIYQKLLLEIAPEIKFSEAAILIYLIGLQEAESQRVKDQKIGDYTRIAYSKLAGDLPLLQVKGRSIGPKLEKLAEYRLADFKHPEDIDSSLKKENRVHFKILQKCEPLIKEINKKNKGPRKGWLDMLVSAGIPKPRAEVYASNVDFFQDNFIKIRTGLASSSSDPDGRLRWLDELYCEWSAHQKA